MTYLTTTALAFGVMLSAVAGLLCTMGVECVSAQLDWLPHADLLLSHPQMALGAGAILIVVSLLCQPVNVD
jgi:hypothetical protein